MSIATELQNYADGLDDAWDAAEDMGATIPTDRNMNNLDDAIRTIPVSSPNDGVLTITQNGVTVQTFTANASSNATANVETIWADPIQATSAIEPLVQTAMIADGAVTTDKLASQAVTEAKIDWGSTEFESSITFGTAPANRTFRKMGNLVVFTFQSGRKNYSMNEVLFTLPSGYRPVNPAGPDGQYFIPGLAVSGSSSTVTPERVAIYQNGEARLEGRSLTDARIYIAGSYFVS